MKVTAPRTIVIQEDGQKPTRYTDAAKAAGHWAQVKADAWVEKHKKDPQYLIAGNRYSGNSYISNLLYDDGRVRYRKLKRRALSVFRRIINES